MADNKRLVATSAASRHALIYLISAMDLIVSASFQYQEVMAYTSDGSVMDPSSMVQACLLIKKSFYSWLGF